MCNFYLNFSEKDTLLRICLEGSKSPQLVIFYEALLFFRSDIEIIQPYYSLKIFEEFSVQRVDLVHLSAYFTHHHVHHYHGA